MRTGGGGATVRCFLLSDTRYDIKGLEDNRGVARSKANQEVIEVMNVFTVAVHVQAYGLPGAAQSACWRKGPENVVQLVCGLLLHVLPLVCEQYKEKPSVHCSHCLCFSCCIYLGLFFFLPPLLFSHPRVLIRLSTSQLPTYAQ